MKRALSWSLALISGAAIALAIPAADAYVLPASGSVRTVGLGFDACSTPSATQMNAWLASPYRTANVYVGGVALAPCDFTFRTSGWVSQVSQMGWHLIPTYVGHQAPCNGYEFSSGMLIPPQGSASSSVYLARSKALGVKDADDAIAQLNKLDLYTGSPVYADMENYDGSNVSCSAGVQQYLNGWSTELKAKGYVSGVYSNSNSGISQLAADHQYTDPNFTEPDDLWMANWNNVAGTSDPYVPSTRWPNNRIHQYQGGHYETWGGQTLNIDSDAINGDTTRIPPTASTVVPPLGRATGSIVGLGQVRLTGYGYIPDATHATNPVSVTIKERNSDGSTSVIRGPFASSVARPDAKAMFPSMGSTPGFDVTVTEPLSTNRTYQVWMADAAGGQHLISQMSFNTYGWQSSAIKTISTPSPGLLHVGGWAYNPTNKSVAADIKVTIGGPLSSSGTVASGTALWDLGRTWISMSSLQASHGVNHPIGFDMTLPVAAGDHPVYLYADGVQIAKSGANIAQGPAVWPAPAAGFINPPTMVSSGSVTLNWNTLPNRPSAWTYSYAIRARVPTSSTWSGWWGYSTTTRATTGAFNLSPGRYYQFEIRVAKAMSVAGTPAGWSQPITIYSK